ncbi:unnamed protein product, partial [Effrenium voratum]
PGSEPGFGAEGSGAASEQTGSIGGALRWPAAATRSRVGREGEVGGLDQQPARRDLDAAAASWRAPGGEGAQPVSDAKDGRPGDRAGKIPQGEGRAGPNGWLAPRRVRQSARAARLGDGGGATPEGFTPTARDAVARPGSAGCCPSASAENAARCKWGAEQRGQAPCALPGALPGGRRSSRAGCCVVAGREGTAPAGIAEARAHQGVDP